MVMNPIARWQPIEGVDLETYTEVSVALLKRGFSGADAEAFLTVAGVSPASWAEASRGWSERIRSNEEVREAYSRLYRGLTSPG
jgi:hypothetical protein